MDRDLVKAITALLPKLRARFGDDDEHVQYLEALAHAAAQDAAPTTGA